MSRRIVTGRQCRGEILRVKAAVRERDNYACTRCGMGHEEHIAIYSKTFDVHRLTPGSLYTLEGCITICRACHGPEPRRKKGEPDLAHVLARLTIEVLPEYKRAFCAAAHYRGLSPQELFEEVVVSQFPDDLSRVRKFMSAPDDDPPPKKPRKA